ncbi:MAG TPA: FkbM family methyltransferase [Opitutaceae bacterium]|nr:FkbM family methyltransferase [Opitutaceae bacterium]
MNPIRRLLPAGRRPRRIVAGLYKDLVVSLDLRGGDFQIWLGLYEAETFTAVRRLLAGCQSALDLGAAKGDLTLHLLRQPGIQRVIAVEPAETELAMFRSNLASNPQISQAALAIHVGFAGEGTPPIWKTLDLLAADAPEPIFIKIDIDGPEAQVLASGRATLARDCRLLIETHSLEAEAGCIRQLREAGYHTEIITQAWWRPLMPEFRPIAHNRWLVAWRTRRAS